MPIQNTSDITDGKIFDFLRMSMMTRGQHRPGPGFGPVPGPRTGSPDEGGFFQQAGPAHER